MRCYASWFAEKDLRDFVSQNNYIVIITAKYIGLFAHVKINNP